MNFEHTEERRMLADSLRRLITEQYGFEARKHLLQSAPGMSRDMWSQLAEMGVIGALFREEDGGYGGGGFDIAVVFEEIGRGLLLEPLLGSAILVGEAIAAAGTPAQKALLEQIIAGQTLAALAHEESDSHYTPTHVATRATQEGDGGWRLQGHKAVVVHAEAADVFLVSARTSGATDDTDGISLFLIPADTAGLQLHGSDTIDGGRVADLLLKDASLPADALLGSPGDGAALLERILGRGVLALCAEALGAMEVAKEATLDYLRTRKQFGLPIGSFQALQHRMADLLLEVEQARSAVINAAAALDADRLTRERALSAAKFSIGRIGTLVAEESIQLHGGIGMTWELPLSHYAKRLVMIDHQLGDEDHHLQRYIALGREVPA
ncbi:acyl-CoA dehydrogenase [Herbaspirillum huttiense F1]|uniref:Acyl-CoA dehydrogenase n=1 Tax=Herbaspirillum huttiense subsp. lycopersici TaxID=3074428 RepID=A0ABU2ENU1_9BURK|nr:acyl-CoA dehydrogenase [Herbaspirillum huttiense]MDR9849443.1 acyl-CoA dehydrogenase [Herbaspirillum huttiense SE1]MDT0357304.1 acyl-CoA dehydrogenase [Herbaspirillum huttiense F1]